MTQEKELKAKVRYSNATLAEKAAREAHDQAGVEKATQEQQAALNELYELEEARRTNAHEERVTVISPNSAANLTDALGTTFVDGRAKGVCLSVAQKYLQDFDGYQVEKEQA